MIARVNSERGLLHMPVTCLSQESPHRRETPHGFRQVDPGIGDPGRLSPEEYMTCARLSDLGVGAASASAVADPR